MAPRPDRPARLEPGHAKTGWAVPPPSELTARAGDSQVTLTWRASPTPGVYYWLEYQANDGVWKRNNLPITTCCSHMVSTLVNGTTYGFRLRATNLSGDSEPSTPANAKPMPPFPVEPAGLSATAGDGLAGRSE